VGLGEQAMSQNLEVVRKPLRARERSSRTLDQRLGIRFPKLSRISGRLLSRLPPISQLRQAALWRAFRMNAEAFNRQDFEAVLLGYHPDFEFRPPRELADSGICRSELSRPRRLFEVYVRLV
jgi:hypothetical protein